MSENMPYEVEIVEGPNVERDASVASVDVGFDMRRRMDEKPVVLTLPARRSSVVYDHPRCGCARVIGMHDSIRGVLERAGYGQVVIRIEMPQHSSLAGKPKQSMHAGTKQPNGSPAQGRG